MIQRVFAPYPLRIIELPKIGRRNNKRMQSAFYRMPNAFYRMQSAKLWSREPVRRRWRSQAQAQCVPRSIKSRISVSPMILSGTANVRS